MQRKLKHIISKFFKKNTNVINYHLYNVTKSETVVIGDRTIIADSVLGSNNRIGSDCYLHNVKYGDYTYNSIRTTLINCSIGKFCSIAQNVSVGLGKHPINSFVSMHPAFYSVHKQCGKTFVKDQFFTEMGFVEIGNDVWLGANSIILDDVKIGNGAVVAANSVVTHDVPAYAVVGGNPAKIIKYRFTEEEISFLEEFKWWDKPEEWLIQNYKLMHDIKLLKEYKL
jgi:acetyltransferase-like isoleucine patch superfamily enzyme